MLMTFNPAPVPPEQPVSEQVPADHFEERPAEESREEISAPAPVPAPEQTTKPVQNPPLSKSLQASIFGRVLRVELPEEADFERSVILVNGTRMSQPEMELEQDGEILLSWQLCDEEGTILESREQILQADWTGPEVDFGLDRNTLWITEEKELSFIISDESDFTWETFLDGTSLGKAESVHLQPGNQNLTVIARDEHGNQTLRSLKIMKAPSVVSDWAAESVVRLQDGLLNIELDGDYQGCFVRAEKNRIQSDLFCDSALMELRLPFDGDMKLTLIHPALGELQSWIITREEKPAAAPVAQPVQQSAPAAVSAEQIRPEVPSAEQKIEAAEQKPALEVWSGKEKVQAGERLYLEAGVPASLNVQNGKLEKMEFSIDGKTIAASSLEQALQDNPQAVITASIEARDLASQLVRQEVEIARIPEPVKTTISAMNTTSEITFSLDEKGTLSVQDEPAARSMTSSVTVGGITTWKWYGFNPQTMNVYINETRVEEPQTGKNFFGKTYVEVQVEGPALVQIEENGVLHHSEIVGARGGNQVLYSDNTGAVDITGPVLALGAVLASIPVFRLIKRRKAARKA